MAGKRSRKTKRERARKSKRPHPKAIAAAKHSHADAGPDRIVCLLCGETYKAITYTHLVRTHGFDAEHPIQEYKAMFGLEVAVPEEQRELMRETALRRHRRIGNNLWTKASVVAAIRQRAAKGLPLCFSSVSLSLREGARRTFGTWDEALRACGEDPVQHRLLGAWSNERVMQEVRHMARAGRVSGKRAQAEQPTMYNVAVRRHRSWGNVLRAAGLDPSEHRETRGRRGKGYKRLDWTREAVVEAIQARQRAGLPLHRTAVVQTDGQALTHQARNRFGSWDAALLAAGVDPEQTRRRRRNWTRAEAVARIRARHRAGRSLLYRVAMAEEPRLVKAAQRLFPSSWAKALAAAGFDPDLAHAPPARTSRPRRRGHK
jgi:hypothetical protein